MTSPLTKALLVIGLLTLTTYAQNHCTTHQQCIQYYEQCPQQCLNTPSLPDNYEEQCICQHKSLTRFSFYEVLGVIILSILTMLANAGGIGGGALMLPVITLLLFFHQNQAGAISNALVFVSSVTRFICTCKQSHPRKNWTLIQYSVVTVLMPMGLLGTLVGVYLNVTLPQGVQVILLTVVLAYVGYKTISKGINIYKQESAGKVKSTFIENVNRDDSNENTHSYDPLISENQRTHCPFNKLIYIWIVFFTILIVSTLRGSKGNSIIGILHCSAADWILQTFTLLVCVIITFLSARSLLAQYRRKQQLGYEFDKQDIKWNSRNIIFLSSLSLLCGAIAAAVGIGGGVLYNPLMLALGMNPQVGAATGAYIIMYNTLSTTLQLLILERLPLFWTLFLAIFVILSSIVGIKVVNKYIKKSGRQSIIVFLLGGFIAVAAVVLPIFSFLTMAGKKSYNIWSAGDVCS